MSPVIIYYQAVVPRVTNVAPRGRSGDLKDEAVAIQSIGESTVQKREPVADSDSDLMRAFNVAYLEPVGGVVPAADQPPEPAKRGEAESTPAASESVEASTKVVTEIGPNETAPVESETPAGSTQASPTSTEPPNIVEPIAKEEKTEASSGIATLEPAAEAKSTSIAANVASMNNEAVGLTKESRYDEALELLFQAVAAAPDSYRLHRNLSIVYENMKRLDEALASAETAVHLAPKEPSALIQLCGLLVLVQKATEAVGCYERLAALQPMDAMDQTYYGVALFRSGKLDSAVSVLEKAAMSAVAGPTLNALGVCYYELKRFADAVTAFKQAVERTPDHSAIRFNLAIAQLAAGNREGAISQYRLLKTDDPKLAAQLYRILFSGKVVSVAELKH
jgi:Flp pilus assembly protein TadD